MEATARDRIQVMTLVLLALLSPFIYDLWTWFNG
jgi:hypothetical protein